MCLPEHLLTECDAKGQYEECPKSGMAIKKSEMKGWKEGPNYKAKPTGRSLCSGEDVCCWVCVVTTQG